LLGGAGVSAVLSLFGTALAAGAADLPPALGLALTQANPQEFISTFLLFLALSLDFTFQILNTWYLGMKTMSLSLMKTSICPFFFF